VCAALLGTSTPERERAIAEATRLERDTWPARQRARLLYAQVWLYARLGRYEEALACARQQLAANRQEDGDAVTETNAMANVAAMELLLGRPQAALEHSSAAIARLAALGAGAFTGWLHWLMTIALIMLDRLDQSADAARQAYAFLLPEGDEFQLLATLALLAALKGRLADATRIIGHDDAVLARTGKTVRPLAAMLRARLEPLLATLPKAERARLRAEGAAMRGDQVFKLGFGDDV
jgi:tetratricopeptide (TPR) repeat protein